MVFELNLKISLDYIDLYKFLVYNTQSDVGIIIITTFVRFLNLIELNV